MIRKILVPTDFSQLSLGVLQYIRSAFPGAEVVLLHVIESAPSLAFPVVDGSSETTLRGGEEPALRELRRVAASPAGLKLNIAAAVRRGEPAHEIARAAEAEGADLIVLATHGRTGLAHVFLGSVAEKTVRYSTVPVLTVRPAGFAPGRARAGHEAGDAQVRTQGTQLTETITHNEGRTMKRLFALLVASVLLLSVAGMAQNKYVGVKTCAPCHKTEKSGNQFGVWQKSPHASAFATLSTPKAAEIAKAKGLKKAASESPECLECHILKADGIDPKDGVQCENCHGAGSAYKTMATMKDHAKAVAAGLADFKDDAAKEKLCVTCHNEKSPTYKKFDFKTSWAKIAHMRPKKS